MIAPMRQSPATRLYGGKDPRDIPAYPLWEVAHFLWMARAKLGRWAFGYEHEGQQQPPVIRLADVERRMLSFNNLAELHVLSALRHYMVPLQRIRGAVTYIRNEVVGRDHLHPLLAMDLHTDGLNIFIEHLGQFVNVNKHGQGALRDVFQAHLKRIERDPNSGTALRLFPFVRPPDHRDGASQPADGLPQPRPVTIDPLISHGRPVLVGTRIPTVELANRFSAGEPIESLAEDLAVDRQAIEEALRYQLATRAA